MQRERCAKQQPITLSSCSRIDDGKGIAEWCVRLIGAQWWQPARVELGNCLAGKPILPALATDSEQNRPNSRRNSSAVFVVAERSQYIARRGVHVSLVIDFPEGLLAISPPLRRWLNEQPVPALPSLQRSKSCCASRPGRLAVGAGAPRRRSFARTQR